MNHTPGPWTFKEQPVKSAGFYIETVDKSHKKTFIGEVGGGFHSGAELRANARLISAAPEMYALLSEIFFNEGMMPDTMGKINQLLNRVNYPEPASPL